MLYIKMVRLIACFLVIVLITGSACNSGPFNLKYYLVYNGTSGEPISDGMATLQFGAEKPFPVTQPDARGMVEYRGVSGKYLNDSIKLVFTPSGNRRCRVLDQSAYTAKDQKVIYFTLDFPSDNTTFEWSLRDQAGNGIAGALIKVMNGKYQVESGSNGYFALSLPKAAGEKALFEIEKDGKTLLKQEIEIAPEYRRLVINPQ
jgi:hypothetical protein